VVFHAASGCCSYTIMKPTRSHISCSRHNWTTWDRVEPARIRLIGRVGQFMDRHDVMVLGFDTWSSTLWDELGTETWLKVLLGRVARYSVSGLFFLVESIRFVLSVCLSVCQWRNNRACKACSARGPSAVGAQNSSKINGNIWLLLVWHWLFMSN